MKVGLNKVVAGKTSEAGTTILQATRCLMDEHRGEKVFTVLQSVGDINKKQNN